ncbi:hypothetical protein GCM10027597_04760 [Saccharopolyspora tripterygii]
MRHQRRTNDREISFLSVPKIARSRSSEVSQPRTVRAVQGLAEECDDRLGPSRTIEQHRHRSDKVLYADDTRAAPRRADNRDGGHHPDHSVALCHGNSGLTPAAVAPIRT